MIRKRVGKRMKDKRVLLLGLGMQGKAALYDLVRNQGLSVIVAESSPSFFEELEKYPGDLVEGRQIDANDEDAVLALMRRVDLVVDALPSPIGIKMGPLAASQGVSLVSSIYYISPSEQDQDKLRAQREWLNGLNELAEKRGACILIEFGLDPGIDLVLGAKALREVDEALEFYSYGAGVPAAEASGNPLRYKFSWSPAGVMRAYGRAARIVKNGRPVNIGAAEVFSAKNVHLLDIPEIGVQLEWYYNGDAVRYAEHLGIADTVRETARYTGRYPGHSAFWEVMSRSGFLSAAPIKVGDTEVVPLEFTAALLAGQTQFQYAGGERDLAMVRVDVSGVKNGARKRFVYQLVDTRDLTTGFTAMQRTVGFTLALGAELILGDRLKRKGVVEPTDVPFDLVVSGLAKRGMIVTGGEILVS